MPTDTKDELLKLADKCEERAIRAAISAVDDNPRNTGNRAVAMAVAANGFAAAASLRALLQKDHPHD